MELDPHFWERLLRGVVGTLVFGLIGILLAVAGFKVFDWITPKLDIEKELAENRNMAVATVVAAVILGVSVIVAVAVH